MQKSVNSFFLFHFFQFLVTRNHLYSRVLLHSNQTSTTNTILQSQYNILQGSKVNDSGGNKHTLLLFCSYQLYQLPTLLVLLLATQQQYQQCPARLTGNRCNILVWHKNGITQALVKQPKQQYRRINRSSNKDASVMDRGGACNEQNYHSLVVVCLSQPNPRAELATGKNSRAFVAGITHWLLCVCPNPLHSTTSPPIQQTKHNIRLTFYRT